MLVLHYLVNILIYEEEFEEVIKYVEFLYINKVDAIIMQDLGLMRECHKIGRAHV